MDYTEYTTTFMDINVTQSDDNDVANEIERLLWVYISPIIFFFGLTGNILIIVVFHKTTLLKSSTSVYMSLMAISDIAVLVFGIIPEWLEACEFVTIKELHPWACKWDKFLFYTFGDQAIWILCAFTCDRFIAVCFPLRKRQFCTPKRSFIVCGLLTLCAIVKNMHVFWTRGAEYDPNGELIKNCGQPEPYTHFEQYIRPWIAFTLVSIIPFIIILVCNCLIIRTLLRVTKEMSKQSTSDTKFSQTVIMCLSASFAFLLFITPSIVLLIGKPAWTTTPEAEAKYSIAKSVINQFVFVNHSINFFLYCVTGRRFREQLILVLKCQTLDGSPSKTNISSGSHNNVKGKPVDKYTNGHNKHDVVRHDSVYSIPNSDISILNGSKFHDTSRIPYADEESTS